MSRVDELFAMMMATRDNPTEDNLSTINATVSKLDEDESARLSLLLAADLAKRGIIVENGFKLFAHVRLGGVSQRLLEAMHVAFYYGASHAKTTYDLALGAEDKEVALSILRGLDEEMTKWHGDQQLREMPSEGSA